MMRHAAVLIVREPRSSGEAMIAPTAPICRNLGFVGRDGTSVGLNKWRARSDTREHMKVVVEPKVKTFRAGSSRAGITFSGIRAG